MSRGRDVQRMAIDTSVDLTSAITSRLTWLEFLTDRVVMTEVTTSPLGVTTSISETTGLRMISWDSRRGTGVR